MTSPPALTPRSSASDPTRNLDADFAQEASRAGTNPSQAGAHSSTPSLEDASQLSGRPSTVSSSGNRAEAPSGVLPKTPARSRVPGGRVTLTPSQFEAALDEAAQASTRNLHNVMNLFLMSMQSGHSEDLVDSLAIVQLSRATPRRPAAAKSSEASDVDGGMRDLSSVALQLLMRVMPRTARDQHANYFERFEQVVGATCAQWKTADLWTIARAVDEYLMHRRAPKEGEVYSHLKLLSDGIAAALDAREDKIKMEVIQIRDEFLEERRLLMPIMKRLEADIARLRRYGASASTRIAFESGFRAKDAKRPFDPGEGQLGQYGERRYHRFLKEVALALPLDMSTSNAYAIDAIAGLNTTNTGVVRALLASLSAHELAAIQQSPASGLMPQVARVLLQDEARKAEHVRLLADLEGCRTRADREIERMASGEPAPSARYRTEAHIQPTGFELLAHEVNQAAAIAARLREHFPDDAEANTAVHRLRIHWSGDLNGLSQYGIGEAEPGLVEQFNVSLIALGLAIEPMSAAS